ncbi:MAG TPA: hypothetical protein VH083_18840 [Myxococcales bacterium]|nr:hypothetical protein [Myxococcales bacterium]
MKRISSGMTFYNKRILPVVWLGGLTCFAAFFIFGTHYERASALALPLIPLGFIGGVGFLQLRRFVWDLADEVWEWDDETLIVKKSGREERVELANVVNVGWSRFSGTSRIVLTLRVPGTFGREVAFMAPGRWLGLGRNVTAEELIGRVDAVRRRA